MCSISFHPRVASGLAKLAASFLKYGWIPCMLIMYAFPPVSVKIEPRTLRSSQNHDPQLSAKLNLPKLDSLKDMIVSAISSATSEEEKDSLKLKYGDVMANLPPLSTEPPSKRFVFHNKMPKSGSSTMKFILTILAKANDFTLDHQRLCVDIELCEGNDDDGANGVKVLQNYMKNTLDVTEGKYLLLKHHHWLNMTELGLEQATYINVVRDPVARFASRYYFNRFGWGLQAGARRQTWKEEEEINQTLDECVGKGSQECVDALQVMVQYFCGTDANACGTKDPNENEFGVRITDWDKTRGATEIAKKHIIQDYYMIGILEHFDETLDLFDIMLPEFFSGAKAASKTDLVQGKQESTKTHGNAGYSNETREILEKGVLRYEMDLYYLCKAVFFKRLEYHGISPP